MSQLGLSCPVNGNPYVCNNAKIRFVGCCTIDPCADGSGNCPQSSIQPTTFSATHYTDIPAQSCVAPYNASTWYTCQANSPPFLGCCKSNPCSQGKCPTADLLAAKLSDNEADAQIFINNMTTSTTGSSSGGSSSSSPGLSSGAIAGIVVAAVALVCIALAAILTYVCCVRRKRKRQQAGQPGSPPYGADSKSEGGNQSSIFSSNAQQQQQWHHPGSTAGGSSIYTPSPFTGQRPFSQSPHFYQGVPTSEQYHSSYPRGMTPIEAEAMKRDPRHVSGMSGTSWNSTPTAAGQQHHAQAYRPMELEDTDRLRNPSELPVGNE